MRSSSLVVVAAGLVATLAMAANTNSLIASARTQRAQDANINGVAVRAVDSTGSRSDASIADGFAAADNSKRMSLSTAVRGNTYGEVLLAVVVQQLIQELVLPQPDENIPSRLLPAGLPFINPNFAGQPLTLRMLLTHTSSLIDRARFDQAPFLVSAGSTVTDVRTFCESYFLSVTGGTSSVATDIWGTNEPGQAASYQYAKSNVALLTYVVQQTIGERTSLVTGQQKTVGALIQERVLNPLGMTSTYFLLPDGTSPLTQLGLANLVGGRSVEATPSPIHASYVSDYMLVTSASDMAKLANALFVQGTGTMRSVGTALINSLRPLASRDDTRGGVTHQGFGIVAYDVNVVCGNWRGLGAAAAQTCPFSTTRAVYGYGAQSRKGTVVFVCSADVTQPTATTSVATSCAAATYTVSATEAADVPISRGQAITTEAINQIHTTTVVAPQSLNIVTTDAQTRGVPFGVAVFFGVVGIISFIFIISYFVEFIVRPIAVTGDVIASAYPKLDHIMDDDEEASPLRLGDPTR